MWSTVLHGNETVVTQILGAYSLASSRSYRKQKQKTRRLKIAKYTLLATVCATSKSAWQKRTEESIKCFRGRKDVLGRKWKYATRRHHISSRTPSCNVIFPQHCHVFVSIGIHSNSYWLPARFLLSLFSTFVFRFTFTRPSDSTIKRLTTRPRFPFVFISTKVSTALR